MRPTAEVRARRGPPSRRGHAVAVRNVAVATAVFAALAALTGCTGGDPGSDARPAPTASPASTHGGSAPDSADEPSPAPDTTSAPSPSTRVEPISLEQLSRSRLPGSALRIRGVRERTAAFTSYDVAFGSTLAGAGTGALGVTGVLNVPAGRGPFPAVVLAHGYIDPAVYVSGQGMTRERGYLAARGFVALHVDYRNHAGSARDPRVSTAVRLGYVTDVIAAAKALVASPAVRVDPRRIAIFGRSMGGGVALKALTVEPGLFRSAVAWASVSSLEAENYRTFMTDPGDPGDSAEARRMQRRHGLPDQAPAFWRGLSPRPRFDRVTEPVLLVHGRYDDTCPPRWAAATQRALVAAGVRSQLAWYDDGHAFGPAFDAAMGRTVRFLR